MLWMPMSSPQMTRMFGFLSAAAARRSPDDRRLDDQHELEKEPTGRDGTNLCGCLLRATHRVARDAPARGCNWSARFASYATATSCPCDLRHGMSGAKPRARPPGVSLAICFTRSAHRVRPGLGGVGQNVAAVPAWNSPDGYGPRRSRLIRAALAFAMLLLASAAAAEPATFVGSASCSG